MQRRRGSAGVLFGRFPVHHRSWRPRNESRRNLEIRDERGERRIPFVRVAHPQNRRRMHCHQSVVISKQRHDFSPHAMQCGRPACQGMRRRRAQRDDQAGSNDRDLAVEPPAALPHFILIGPFMQPTLAARFVFEMFDRVGDVDLVAVETGFIQGAIEHTPGRPDKRMALPIFLITRLFADKHEVGTGIAVPKYRLRRVLIERAALADRRFFSKRSQLSGVRWMSQPRHEPGTFKKLCPVNANWRDLIRY
jgi:hypothetical protein